MDRDITEVFENFIKEYRSLEDSSDAFFEALDADEILQDEYREWCDAMGYSEKKVLQAIIMSISKVKILYGTVCFPIKKNIMMSLIKNS